ncbi:alpha/beta hydrolase family protein [Sphingomonas crocodyli]|uniref:S9 family peptidase n=1 Tax=Sphingomonas crocodyli TaxID=1979270 RepID=A0A437LWU3_9SPHN|nr:S9 family peptidase [Sphingomonas crocodyli]RVT89871.1 S9 family peptidase [Sphingomonas crocodyli]
MIAIFPAGAAALAIVSGAALAQSADFDAAKVFGAREAISNLSLSPDGRKIAYIVPTVGAGSALYTIDLDSTEPAKRALADSGDPDRLQRCNWVSNTRLVCTVYGVIDKAYLEILPFTRTFAVDVGGGNPKMLSNRENANSLYQSLGGGDVVDWLPDEDGMVLMTRNYVPQAKIGSLIEKKAEGLGVDRINTSTLSSQRVEPARDGAVEYISDGKGVVRIAGYQHIRGETGQASGIINYFFRMKGQRNWIPFGQFDSVKDTGFNPYSVDAERDVVYGMMKKDGRWAAYEMPLDGSDKATLIYAHPDVDVGGFRYVGRQRRVVGVSYTTDKTSVHYIDPAIEKLRISLEKAVPGKSLSVVDASRDESRLLLFGGNDTDPGAYYLFDRPSRQLAKVLDVRPQLTGRAIAEMKSISYKAADGTMIPAYLQIPVGMEGKKVPAIVMPHGGPSSRDYWGFDWLSAFFVARGYAVIQPQFRGSSGYGDAWFQKNGFQSWKVAIGDVNDAGRYLIGQGIADPGKVAIFGWSYGGYAALQSAVTEPGLFKAVVAVAPVTDLNELKEESRNWTNFRIVSDYIGSGPHIAEGSPARHADRIKAPVLLFHGEKDRNVRIGESRLMDSRLASAGVPHEFVAYPKLDHYLEDSAVREQMLRKSDEFIRKAMGM